MSITEWDTPWNGTRAANQVIVEEAGGEMRQLDAARSPFTYNRENSLNANGFYILNRPENKLVPDDFYSRIERPIFSPRRTRHSTPSAD